MLFPPVPLKNPTRTGKASPKQLHGAMILPSLLKTQISWFWEASWLWGCSLVPLKNPTNNFNHPNSKPSRKYPPTQENTTSTETPPTRRSGPHLGRLGFSRGPGHSSVPLPWPLDRLCLGAPRAQGWSLNRRKTDLHSDKWSLRDFGRKDMLLTEGVHAFGSLPEFMDIDLFGIGCHFGGTQKAWIYFFGKPLRN